MATTKSSSTPIVIRAPKKLGDGFEARVRSTLARRLVASARVSRATVRFEDANGPKGGVDNVCRIKLMLDGLEPIVVEKQAATESEAFAAAEKAVATALKRTTSKPRASRAKPRTSRATATRTR